jgi:methionyl-tRNA formyltransferase
LRARLVDVGTRLLLDALDNGLGDPEPQVGEPTYAHKIDPAELELDWSRPPVELHRLIRLGGAWTTHHGRRLKVWRSRLVDGGSRLELVEVQPEGRPRMAFADWARGARWQPGDPLGT